MESASAELDGLCLRIVPCGVGLVDDAFAFHDVHRRVVHHRDRSVLQLVERESVLVVLRKVERVACEYRGECAADHVRERAFVPGVDVLLDEVEDSVPVACEHDLAVVNPVHVALVVAFGAHDLHVLAVRVYHGDAAMHVVKETEGDSLAVGAVLGAIDVVVPEFRVGHVDVYRVFCRVFAEVCGEGDLAQNEARAEGFAQGECDGGSLRVDCGVDGIGEVGDRDVVLVGVADGNVEVGVSVLVAVLERHVGENRAFFRGVVHVDALVEPGLFRAESVLGVVADVDGRVLVLDGNLPDFDAVDLFAGILRESSADSGIRFDFGILKTAPSNHGPPKFDTP